jgi:PIN domain nuclease of toxin-antitoxin system
VKALLDTHTFLWWNMNDPQLSRTAREFIIDGSNEIYLSAASAWEITLKAAKGRLILPETPGKYIADRINHNQFISLPVQISHAVEVFHLSEIHNDPFDRLLIAQSRLEDLAIITIDERIKDYEVETIW